MSRNRICCWWISHCTLLCLMHLIMGIPCLTNVKNANAKAFWKFYVLFCLPTGRVSFFSFTGLKFTTFYYNLLQIFSVADKIFAHSWIEIWFSKKISYFFPNFNFYIKFLHSLLRNCLEFNENSNEAKNFANKFPNKVQPLAPCKFYPSIRKYILL